MNNGDFSPPMMRRTAEWESLSGAVVDVYLHDDLHRRGVVEDVMPASSGLWIAAQGPCSREFIDKASGFAVWTDLHSW